MLITPRPGTNRESILRILQTAHTDASNLPGGSVAGSAYRGLLAYLRWATRSADQLRRGISERDLNALIFTPRYHALLAGAAAGLAGSDQQALVNGLVGMEIGERVEALEAAINSLMDIAYRWSGDVNYVIADTSFYIKHPEKIRDIDFSPLIGGAESTSVKLLFPMIIIDELDRLKESKNEHTRWRAGHTLGVLEEAVNDKGQGPIRPRDTTRLNSVGDSYGEISTEILFDPPGHSRLPNADDEIIDRAVAASVLAGSDRFTLLTYDTGQSTRGRMANLRVEKLHCDAGTGEEPDRNGSTGGTRAKRRERGAAARDTAPPSV